MQAEATVVEKRLSIITAIHNALPMNRVYWRALSQNTRSPFELIIVDNHSTDGSERFFAELARTTRGTAQEVVYLRNEFNQLYPASQNQGMRRATTDILCFLNNDVWVPEGWHLPFETKLRENSLLVLSPSGQEAQPTQSQSSQLKRRWKRASQLSFCWKWCLRKSEEERLWKALEIMYGDLNHFTAPMSSTQTEMIGIKGDSVIFHRNLLTHFSDIWDETVEAADWHLFLTIAKRHIVDDKIPLPRVLLNAYSHHFGRYTAKQKYEPMKGHARLRTIDEVWGREPVRKLWWGYQLPQ